MTRFGIKHSTDQYAHFVPQPDITAYELAKIMQLFEYAKNWNGWVPTPLDKLEASPAEIRRHFEIKEKGK